MIGELGRVPSRRDPRTLRLASYLTERDYPAPPPARDWTISNASWYLNDRLGCCTITALAHLAEVHAARRDERCTITDRDVELAYRAVSGYDGTPATDRGAQMIDALVRAKNVGIGPWRIGAFVRVDLDDVVEVRAAINLFGGIYLGADLPRRIRTQRTAWELPPLDQRTDDDAPNSLGGHAFAITGFDRAHLRGLPWVTPTRISNAWINLYGAEAWAVIADSWVRGDSQAPNGFNLERLRGDLAAIGAS